MDADIALHLLNHFLTLWPQWGHCMSNVCVKFILLWVFVLKWVKKSLNFKYQKHTIITVFHLYGMCKWIVNIATFREL